MRVRRLLIGCFGVALVAGACGEDDGMSDEAEPEDSAEGGDPFANCDLHEHLAMSGRLDCGDVNSEDPADWAVLQECVLARVAAGERFFATWSGGPVVGVQGDVPDPPGAPYAVWKFSNTGWSAASCSELKATPDCTPGPENPCLTCVENGEYPYDSGYCIYM
ncbi:MAG: hypothetical protein JNL82_06875 [Myxococcales bacterium]|nr:hypothetical protein [Myxococcales bacterium]